ncbi:unnamed protein product [Staurois parvus]|uniref:C2H2-type domain-containing protein n=1 Tax=Staurois parvus TaxID=386267 RepID=A0ABN9BG24_9NEOB|nr:unnamed protein product [Staurois parvus]
MHKRSHTCENLYSCPECGKCFVEMSDTCHTSVDLTRGRSHIPVLSVGNTFSVKSNLYKHQRLPLGRSHFPVLSV